MSDNEYLCKDCKHSYINPLTKIASYVFSFKGPASYWYTCTRLPNSDREKFNPVTGRSVIKNFTPFCAVEREHGYCGTEGKYWTPTRKKDLFKLLTKEHK